MSKSPVEVNNNNREISDEAVIGRDCLTNCVNPFVLVYMISLHHELEDPAAAIIEALRLLKSGGNVIIIDWKKEETPEGPPLAIRLTEETIESQMLACGFTNIGKHAVLPYHSFLVGEKIS